MTLYQLWRRITGTSDAAINEKTWNRNHRKRSAEKASRRRNRRR